MNLPAEWTVTGKPHPKQPKSQHSAVFWVAHGILFIDYREKGPTINSDLYVAQLMHFKDMLMKTRVKIQELHFE